MTAPVFLLSVRVSVACVLTPAALCVPCCLSWFQSLEATRWLAHMSSLLRAAVSVARYMDDQGRPVLVHCSDGWDRHTAGHRACADPARPALPHHRRECRETGGGGGVLRLWHRLGRVISRRRHGDAAR